MLRWFHVEPQGINPCAYVPGLYTQAEVDDLINIDGYIPVADADEFDKIRTGAVETMGGCSIWAGSYTTGGDKKYIQIFDIDFAAFGTWATPIPTFTGIYDGNELNISNVTGSDSLFVSDVCDFINMRVVGIITNNISTNNGGICRDIKGGNITNCIVSGDVSASQNACGIASTDVLSARTSNLSISNCSYTGTINSAISGAAGIIIAARGSSSVSISISDCTVNGLITGGATTSGGITASAQYATISNCTNNATINFGSNSAGGIVGNSGVGTEVVGCTNTGNVSATGTYTSGIVGFNSNTSASPKTIVTNCTNTGNVTGTGGHAAGIMCNLTGRYTITGCTNSGNVSGATQFVGGITTYIYNAADIISDCVVQNCSISGAGGANSVRMGGICYFRLGGIVEDCRVENVSFSNPATGSLTTLGGIAGTLYQGVNIVRRCEVIGCTIDGGATGNRVGGIAGFSRSGSTSNLVLDCRVVGGSINGNNLVGGIWGSMALSVDDIENSFCAVAVTGSTNVGGLVGLGVAGAIATDSYWDTDIGPATSSKGTGQTTVALQTPTGNTGIYSAWDALVWDFGTSVEYPELINTP